jgi:hypothetical protein
MSKNDATALVFLIAGLCFAIAVIANAVVKLRAPRKDAGLADTLQALEQRFARVEVALDDVTSELHRVSESNGFLTKLLSDRSRDASLIDRK